MSFPLSSPFLPHCSLVFLPLLSSLSPVLILLLPPPTIHHCPRPLLNVPSPPTIVLILFLLFSMFPPHLPTIVLILFLLFSMFSPHPPLSSSYFSSSQCSHLTHPSTIVFILFHLLSLLSLFTHLLFLLFSSSKHCKSRWLHT